MLAYFVLACQKISPGGTCDKLLGWKKEAHPRYPESSLRLPRQDTGWMGNNSINQKSKVGNGFRRQDVNWEEESYQIGCAVARQEAKQRLQEIDDRLFDRHNPGWKTKDFNERTLATRFGELVISRRLYQDEKGAYHYLLDEYLGWPAHQLATPSLQESLVELATEKSFNQVSHTLSKLTAAVLSSRTIHRLLQKTAKGAIGKEKEDCQAVYRRGELPSVSKHKKPILFSEYDGIWVHLQREEQKQYELKNGIAYEGWEKLSGKEERYQLLNKKVYCQAAEGISFWEGASLEWSRHWDLGHLEKIIIGGDGASWIDSGVEEFAGSIRQLDGFHLARACGRGWPEGRTIYQAIRAGETEDARRLIQTLVPRERPGSQQARKFVERNMEKGQDWRNRIKMEGRGMGSMESNEDKLVANRMKKQGLSWTKEGALRMHKVIQLSATGQIRQFCLRSRPIPKRKVIPLRARSKIQPHGYQKWLQASIPALVGPHASRPWVDNLRDMVYPSFPVN
jgi:hypothetical protein